MNQVDWINQYEQLEEEEVNKLYDEYCQRGFEIVPHIDLMNTSFYPQIIRTPNGKYLTKKNIEEILSNPLIIGNKDQVEAIESAEFFKIANTKIGFQNPIDPTSS
jgi:hypothetical protein